MESKSSKTEKGLYLDKDRVCYKDGDYATVIFNSLQVAAIRQLIREEMKKANTSKNMSALVNKAVSEKLQKMVGEDLESNPDIY
ncbi:MULTISPECIES: hypothetical protein [Lactobacillus]|uniref:Uncharacterized protein n=1 Tax=Lactobacillus xujianguonis TaxID=2495899 RepID=A0A437SSC4_9LACO|nr:MULTISPECIES: hypothetical protein [Lactobacillus]RVU69813.1 hypothetical protein EJK17_11080 [Lactobacillus xujianguonis]RVU71943.1 hypothetical protein EJK20_11180 [Lactobacillus xujianguonis]